MMPIVVIEPHADDAFLSLGQHIEEWCKAGRDITIITVYSGTRRRGVEAEGYARLVGAKWKGLGFVEAGVARGGKIKPLPKDVFDFLVKKSTTIIGPLAFKHPEHQLVKDRLPEGSWYYIDTPYQISSKNREALNAVLAGKTIVSFCKPRRCKWRHTAIFKDQAKFFYFNPMERLDKTFEMIVCES